MVVPNGGNANKAEMVAINMALCWASLLGDGETWQGNLHPRFHIHSNALVAGRKSSGKWGGPTCAIWENGNRGITHYLQARFGREAVCYEHVRGHAGNPWNEAADKLSVACRHGRLGFVCNDGLEGFLTNHACGVEWLWAVPEGWARQLLPPIIGQRMWLRRPKAMTCNATPAIRSHPLTLAANEEARVETGHIKLKAASANVLSLGDGDRKGTSRARVAILMRQAHELGLHLVGLQETRANRAIKASDHYEVLVGAPEKSGHHGVQLWVNLDLPINDKGSKKSTKTKSK